MITLVKKLYAKAMLSDRVVWEARWRSTPFLQPQGGECAVYKGMAFELCLWPSLVAHWIWILVACENSRFVLALWRGARRNGCLRRLGF